jgi:hypothetical protein
VKDKLTQVKPNWLYIITPFCWLLLCLGSLNIAALWKTRSLNPLPVTGTAVPTPVPLPTATSPGSDPISNGTRPTAVMIPSPTTTPYAPPLYNAGKIIHLLGPPSGSTFADNAIISYYWQWPLPLAEDQHFKVYLLTEEQTILLGTLNEPNIGDSYRLQVDLTDVKLTADTLHWLVQLETTQFDQPLRMSESRSLTIFTSSLTP